MIGARVLAAGALADPALIALKASILTELGVDERADLNP